MEKQPFEDVFPVETSDFPLKTNGMTLPPKLTEKRTWKWRKLEDDEISIWDPRLNLSSANLLLVSGRGIRVPVFPHFLRIQ